MSKTFEHDGCVGCKYEKESETSDYCKGCKQNAIDKYVRMTNFDRIKDMSIEEMAEFLDLYCGEICQAVSNCGNCGFDECHKKHNYGTCRKTLEWLEREVEE